jgi:ech hydrogenase subunit A
MEDMEGLATKIPLTKLITTAGILSMFPRPFGILLEKWLALETAYMFPLAAFLF